MLDSVLRRSWLAVLFLSLIISSVKLMSGNSIQTSLFAMFPSETQTEALDIALEHAAGVFEHDLIVLVESQDEHLALQTAQKLSLDLNDLSQIKEINNQQRVSFVSQLFQHRQQLLTDQDYQVIEQGDSAQLTQASVRRLYSPAGINGQSFINDPWQTFERYLLTLIDQQEFNYQDGFLVANRNGTTQVLLQLLISTSAYSSDSIDDIEQLNTVIDQLNMIENVQLYRTGVGFYSASAMELAKNEISIIGGGALLLVIIIVLWLFAHSKPLIMTIASLFSGVLLGLTATLICFGEVHVLALVMGSSLIGLSFDYAFHYISFQIGMLGKLDSRAISRQLKPALMMGMLSSVIAYTCLFLANLPVLNQMALFSVFGLMGALTTVLLCYPQVKNLHQSPRTIIVANLLNNKVNKWFKPKGIWAVVAVYSGIAIWALCVGYTDDDVRILQSPDAQLLQDETYIKQQLGSHGGSDWIITLASSEEKVAQQEEALVEQLNDLIDAKQLSSYMASTQWVPSLHRQERNWQTYKKLVDEEGQSLAQVAGMSVLPGSLAFQPLPSFNANDGVPQLTGQLDDGRYFSLLLLGGLKQPFEREVLSSEQYYLNYVDDIGHMLGDYRQRVTKLLVMAILTVMVLIGIKFGISNLLRLMVSPILAVIIAAALPAALGFPVTLFHVLGLFLIFGIGIDYSIFLLCHGRSSHTILAVFVAGMSSLLSFGLMALSTNYAISSFGITVGLGVLSSWLVAPMVLLGREYNE